MFRLARILAVCIIALASPAAPAMAQLVGATTGAIDGTLRDATGAVLPGVTITAAGEALMAPRTAVSGADGSYRFAALPPGIYSLSFGREGFQSFLRSHRPGDGRFDRDRERLARNRRLRRSRDGAWWNRRCGPSQHPNRHRFRRQ